MRNDSTDVHEYSYFLWRQALSGNWQNTLLAIERNGLDNLTVLTADLLARLYVKEGRIKEARMIWGQVLQRDPGYDPAVAAMNKLESPWWLIHGIVKRFSFGFGIVALFLFGMFGVGNMVLGGADVTSSLVGTVGILTVIIAYLIGCLAWTQLAVQTQFSDWRIDQAESVKTASQPIRIDYKQLGTEKMVRN